MRKVILGLAVSLDSFIEGPNGEIDWCFNDQDYGLTDFFNSIDAILMGRKSYDLSNSLNGSNPWSHIPTYVFSNTLKNVPKPNKLVSGDVAKCVAEIKSESGKDIWLFGGTELISSMMNHKLVDELWLSVHPVVLGGGKPLFQGIENKIVTQLVEAKTYETGLVSLKYKIA